MSSTTLKEQFFTIFLCHDYTMARSYPPIFSFRNGFSYNVRQQRTLQNSYLYSTAVAIRTVYTNK